MTAEDVTERWRQTPHPNYEVSDQGRVRNVVTGRILCGGRAGRGYRTVQLGAGNHRYVHTLVLEAFVGSRPTGLVACHDDDDTDNNALSNLRWDTQAANVRDAIESGAHPASQRGTRPHARAGEVAELRARGMSLRKIATQLGMSYGAVWRAAKGPP